MRNTARTAVSLPALAWQNLFAPSGRKAAGANKALPCRISHVFEYFSPNRMYANSRNFIQNRAISRVPAQRYAISWVRTRFVLSHTISRKCNQQFRSGWLSGTLQFCRLMGCPVIVTRLSYTLWKMMACLAIKHVKSRGLP